VRPERWGRMRTTIGGTLTIAVASIAIAGAFPVTRSRAETVDAVIEQEVHENEDSAAIQKKIDEISDDIDAMVDQYRSSTQNARQLKIYNHQLDGLIESQEKEKASLRRQIDEVTVVGRQVMPLMADMISTLEKFVDLDVPFLLDERHARVKRLKDLMERADVTMSEKYRNIMEAYQIENDYGRSIEAYRGELDTGGQSRTVDFLRIGRNALLYQTLDASESGVWNPLTRKWERCDDYRLEIREGLRMARKQRAPDLIPVPIPAAEVLQ
jgi:hypothetical protein